MDRYAFYSNVERYKDANPEEHEKDAIKHYGIMGQKWGQRRWQNPDGTFNQAGKERYFGSSKNEKNPDGAIGNSSNKKNPSGNMEGSVADHFHKNVYLKTDKNTFKKIKKYPDIYDTEGLTDKEILQAIRRVPKIPYSAEYGRQIREELYRAQMNKKRAKYYDDNSKDVSEEENIEDQKIEGFDPKDNKYLNNDGTLTKKSEEALNKIADKTGLRKGEYSWENELDTILKSDEEYYDNKAKSIIAANMDNIVKMVKALDDNDTEKYMKIRNENFTDDMEKDISEKFVNDIRVIHSIYNDREQIIKDVDESLGKNVKQYLEKDNSLEYTYKNYKDGKPDFISISDFKNYGKKEPSKATESAKEIEKNAEKHFDNILDKLYSSLSSNGKLETWDEDHNNMTKSDFKNYLKDQKYKLVNSGSIEDNGSIMLYLNDADLFWGHVFCVDYNPLTGSFEYYGLEG